MGMINDGVVEEARRGHARTRKPIEPEHMVYGAKQIRRLEDWLNVKLVGVRKRLETCDEGKLKEYQVEIRIINSLLIELQKNTKEK